MPRALKKNSRKIAVVVNLARKQGLQLTLKLILQRLLEDTWLLGKIIECKGPQVRHAHRRIPGRVSGCAWGDVVPFNLAALG